MKYVAFLTLPLLVSSLFSMQQDPRVYPANAGATATQIPQISQNNVIPQQSQNNIFLEYYAKQGTDFSVSVFAQENGSLVKRDISYDSLKKAVVIFFGDWCPHCHKFLTDFSRHIGTLNANGIKVILLNIPSVEKLKNWQDPTNQDYMTALQQLQTYGINVSPNVELVLLADRTSLAKTGVSGLPVFVALKDAKEYFRGVGNKGVSKLQLSDDNVLKQFLEIWGNDSDEDSAKKESADKKKSTTHSKTKTAKKTKQKKTSKSPKLSKTAMIESRTATEMLNNTPWKIDLNSLK